MSCFDKKIWSNVPDIPWGDAYGEQYESALAAGTMSDNYAHCVIICNITKECGNKAAKWTKWVQEVGDWFDYDDPDTNEDLVADDIGRNIANQQNSGSCAYGEDCDEGCHKAGF